MRTTLLTLSLLVTLPTLAHAADAEPESSSATRVSSTPAADTSTAQASANAERISVNAQPTEPLVQPPQEAKTVEHSYGSETFAADGISAGVVLAGLFLPGTKGAVSAIGLGGYALAAPMIHLAHGNPGRALASFGLRIGLPVGLGAAGFYTGFALSGKDCSGYQCFGAAVVGLLLGGAGLVTGMVGASVIDGGVFARERVPVKTTTSAPTLSMSPYFNPSPQGSDVGVRAFGRF
jgi:hypothetical protein